MSFYGGVVFGFLVCGARPIANPSRVYNAVAVGGVGGV